MGQANSIVSSRESNETRPFSPPDQFKFSKIQALKLTVIQAAFSQNIHQCTDNDSVGRRTPTTETNSKINSSPAPLSTSSSFNLSDPQEIFVSTVSTLIVGLNRAAAADPNDNNNGTSHINNFNQNLTELIRIFTAVFIKNMNLKRIVEVFEFEVEEDSRVTLSEHLLTAYVSYLVNARASPTVLDEVLRSFLIILSSNLPEYPHYFHKILLEKFAIDDLELFLDALIGLTCTFTFKNHGFISSIPHLSDKSRLSCQILTCLLLPTIDDAGDINPLQAVFEKINDLKSFALLIKYQAHILQVYPNNNSFSLNDLTVFVIFSSAMMNFSPNYRRFLLSKLDNEELLLIICKVMYMLMKGKLSKKTLLSFNLYLLSEILLSMSEDGTFLTQIFDTKLDTNLIKWYEGDYGGTSNIGGFIFCLLFDLIGANLAKKDGFKDQYLHTLLCSIATNMSQYAKSAVDNRCLIERIFAIFNGIFPLIYEAESIDSDCSKCLVDIIVIVSNLILNCPQGNSLLISNIMSDSSRIIGFLKSYLNYIDSYTNSQISAHLNENDLEFTAVLVGILKFFDKLFKHLEMRPDLLEALKGIDQIMATFPMPTFRRDSHGEIQRLGSKIKLYRPVEFAAWSRFIEKTSWSIIYSSIPWNNFVVE